MKNSLAKIHPELVEEWSSRNYPLIPGQISYGSNKKVWWRCQAGHRWEARISDRSYGSGCPYCTGKVLLKDFNDLATRQQDLVREWSEKNMPLTPDKVTEKSRQNVWWECSECGYEWKSVIWSRVKGCSCPACADRVVLAGYNDLATTNRELVEEWDDEKNTEIRPEQISGKSMRIVWWKCPHGHRWRAKIAERTCGEKSCSVCEAEYRAVFPQFAVAYYARKGQMNVAFNTEEEIGLIIDAYIVG